jgi:predicted phage terminase large subunit-like protein
LTSSLGSRPELLRRLQWIQTARPNQLPPPGDWDYWLLQAGRGFGKTRSGAEEIAWCMQQSDPIRVAIVAPTYGDARDTCVEGESGLLGCIPHENIDDWKRSLGELVLKNGSRAKLFAAEEPNRLRGPQHHMAWAEELSSWQYPDAWDQLIFGLRLGQHPKVVITTTPKPNVLTRKVMADPRTVITRGSTYDNAANLAPSALQAFRAKYEGTRLGRQELHAELLDDVPGALWTRGMIEAARLPLSQPPVFKRIVVAADPSGSDGETGDAQGIVVAGVMQDGRAAVIDDGSVREGPDGWGRQIIRLFDLHKADLIVAERNFGGEMVRRVIQTVRAHAPVKLVTASRGKAVRAEPVAALYEQKRVIHLCPMPELEDQMCQLTSDGFVGPGSPDRVDALVWALTELMLTATAARTVNVSLAG